MLPGRPWKALVSMLRAPLAPPDSPTSAMFHQHHIRAEIGSLCSAELPTATAHLTEGETQSETIRPPVFINEVTCRGIHFQSSPGWSYFFWRAVWVSGYKRQSALRRATILCILCIFTNWGTRSRGNYVHSTSRSALCWCLKLRKLNHWGK